MEFLTKLFEYFIPTSRTLPAKTAFIIVTGSIVIFLNDYVGLSYHYTNGRKISEIERLNAIIKDTMTDNQGKKYAIALRDEVMSHQSLFDRIVSSFSKTAAISSETGQKPTAPSTPNSISPKRNNLVFILTSSGVFIAFAIIAIPLMLIAGENGSFMQNVAFALLTTISFMLVGLATYALASILPLFLRSTWLLNYFVNIILQAGLMYLFVRYNAYSKRQVLEKAKNKGYDTFNKY